MEWIPSQDGTGLGNSNMNAKKHDVTQDIKLTYQELSELVELLNIKIGIKIAWLRAICDACVFNGYRKYQRLGYHSDLAEMLKALKGGCAIVTISIGCDADFYFWDEKKSETHKVTLKHGSAFVFGGLFRLMPHKVEVLGSCSTGNLSNEMRNYMGIFDIISLTARVCCPPDL